MAAHNRDFYNNLPLYARLADEQETLKHFCEAGIQPDLNNVYRILGSLREYFFDPRHPASEGNREWLAQFVGGGRRGDNWIGIGINPDWEEDYKTEVIFQLFQYFQSKGTLDSVEQAIRMWLRHDGPVILQRPTPSAPKHGKWFDYHTRYDAPFLQPFQERKLLGGGDYCDTRYRPDWDKLSPKQPHWDYVVPWNRILEHEYAQEIITRGSRIGPRNIWKHLEVDNHEEWNKVFPDIETLDFEALPVLTKNTNIGWLTYRDRVDLGIDLQPNPDIVQNRKTVEFEIEGFKFSDVFPVYQYPPRLISIIEETEDYWVGKNQWVDYFYQWPRLQDTLIPLSQRLKIVVTAIPPVFPYAEWGSLYQGYRYQSETTNQTWQSVLIEGNRGWQWQQDWYSATQPKRTVVTATTEIEGNYQTSARWNDLSPGYSWYFAPSVQTEQTITEELAQIGPASYYSPTYTDLQLIETTTVTPPPETPAWRSRFQFQGYQWPTKQLERTIETTSVSSILQTFERHDQYYAIAPEITQDAPPDEPESPVSREWIAINWGCQWGDSRSQFLSYPETIQLGSIIGQSTDWNNQWGQAHSWYATGERTLWRSQEYPPFKTVTDLWRDRYMGSEVETTTTWHGEGLNSASHWETHWGILSWHHKIYQTTDNRRIGAFHGTSPYATPIIETEPIPIPPDPTTPDPAPQRLDYWTYQWENLTQWYAAVFNETTTITTTHPGFETAGYPYKRDAYSLRDEVIDEAQPSINPKTWGIPWYNHIEATQTETTEVVTPTAECQIAPTNPTQIRFYDEADPTWIPGESLYPVNEFEIIEGTTETEIVRVARQGIYPGWEWQTQQWPSLTQIPIDYQTQIIPGEPEIAPPYRIEKIAEESTTETIDYQWHGNFPGAEYTDWWFGYVPPTLEPMDLDLPSYTWEARYTSDFNESIELEPEFAMRPIVKATEKNQWWYYPARRDETRTVVTSPEQWVVRDRKVATHYQSYGQTYSWHHLGRNAVPDQQYQSPIFGKIPLKENESWYFAEIEEISQTVKQPDRTEYSNKYYASYLRKYGDQQIWYVFDQQMTGYWQPGEVTERVGELCNIPDLYTKYDLEFYIEKNITEIIEGDLRETYPLWTRLHANEAWALAIETISGVALKKPTSLLWQNRDGNQYSRQYQEGEYDRLFVEFVLGIHELQNPQIRSLSLMLDRHSIYSDTFHHLLRNNRNYIGIQFIIPVKLTLEQESVI